MSLFYLAAEYRRTAFTVVRRLVVLTGILALVVYASGLWPAIRYCDVAGIYSASWDVRVNGPMGARELGRIAERFASPGDVVVGLSSGESTLRGPRGRTVSARSYLCDPGDEPSAAALLLGDGIRVAGASPSAGECAIDAGVARRLGVRVGDTIELSNEVRVREDGPTVSIDRTAKIAEIFGPNQETEGVLLAIPAGARTGAAGLGADYTDVYVRTSGGPASAMGSLSGLDLSTNRSVFRIDEARKAADRALLTSGGNGFTGWALAAGMALYVVYLMRDQFVRVARRRRAFAVAYSLGERLGGIVRLMLAEQLAICLITAAAGLAVGYLWIDTTTGLYVPGEAVRAFALCLLGLNAFALALLAGQLWVSLRQLPVARLLSSGKAW